MKLKKLFLITSIIFTLCLAFGITANATEIVDSGTCGENVTWTLDSDGVLTISGEGEMKNYNASSSAAPWFSYRKSIKSVIIDDGVTSIGRYAFACCKLTDTILPNSVTSICSYAFTDCVTLTSINIPLSTTNIDSFAFYGCSSLETVYWNAKNVADFKSFYSSQQESSFYMKDFPFFLAGSDNGLCVIFGETVERIPRNAFYNCYALNEIKIPDNVISIGKNAFYNTEYYNDVSNWEDSVLYIDNHLIKTKNTIVDGYSIKQNTKTIADNAIESCSMLTNITIPQSVTEIGREAFMSCTNLTNITIPNSVTSIKESTFSGCSKLESITIPKSITSIKSRAFSTCASLSTVYYKGDINDWESISIYNYADENTAVLAFANIIYMAECSILQITSPANAIIADTEITATVENSIDNLQVDVTVNNGANWWLYRTQSATKPLDNNTATGLREGRDNVYYIKTLAADETTTKTYKLTIYRNTKSTAPTISANRDKVTIVADNCEIYYTIDGTTPTESSLKYTEPFSAPSKAVIKAIAKESGKDEVSDIIEYTVPEYITTNIETIYVDKVTNACEYSFYVTSDGTPSGTFIVAIYNDKGHLIGTKLKPVTIDGEQEISDTVDVNGTPDTYKAFFWDAFNSLKPLCDMVSDNV